MASEFPTELPAHTPCALTLNPTPDPQDPSMDACVMNVSEHLTQSVYNYTYTGGTVIMVVGFMRGIEREEDKR